MDGWNQLLSKKTELENEGGLFEIIYGQDLSLKAFDFQTKIMRDLHSSYNDFILLDKKDDWINAILGVM